MLAGNIPAGIHRKQWGFMKWNDFNPELWESVMDDGLSEMQTPVVPLHGADRSPRAVAAAKENLHFSGLEKNIGIEVCALSELEPPFEKGFIIFNPPYDERIKIEDSLAFYKMIGDSLKQNFTGFTAWLISSDLDSVKFIGLRPSRKIQIFNGPLECRFLRFDLFKGRSKYQFSESK
jgi:putative N6-adenine-specific DNA methylase